MCMCAWCMFLAWHMHAMQHDLIPCFVGGWSSPDHGKGRERPHSLAPWQAGRGPMARVVPGLGLGPAQWLGHEARPALTINVRGVGRSMHIKH